MKFEFNKHVILNTSPPEKIEKVSSSTEYESLRAEKLFRYEYANQLNTSLLTFAFTIYTAGLALFALIFEFGDFFIMENTAASCNGKDIYALFVEYFFACFFLLPCFFARINFLYTVNNSLRIGQLTEYTREKIQFDDEESWESFKRKYKVNYFYRTGVGVGGAKEIPFCINIISPCISFAIGVLCLYVFIQNNHYLHQFAFKIIKVIFFRIGLSITVAIICQKTTKYIKKRAYLWIFLLNLIQSYLLFIQEKNANDSSQYLTYLPYFLIIFIWLELLQFCIFIMPQYDREILLANSVVEYTRAKLQYTHLHKISEQCSEKEKEQLIFRIFLKNSSVVKLFINSSETDGEKIIERCENIFFQMDSNNFYAYAKDIILRNYIYQKLKKQS